MDNGQYINLLARIEAIKAEIEAAKLDNWVRQQEGLTELNYPSTWFWEKAGELSYLSAEPFK